MRNLFVAVLFIWGTVSALAEVFQIENVYQKEVVKKGTIALDRYGKEREVESLLIPADLKVGQYKVVLRREDSNLYEVKGKSLYIKTKSCYKYGYSIEAVLVVKSNYGYNRFELIIPDN